MDFLYLSRSLFLSPWLLSPLFFATPHVLFCCTASFHSSIHPCIFFLHFLLISLTFFALSSFLFVFSRYLFLSLFFWFFITFPPSFPFSSPKLLNLCLVSLLLSPFNPLYLSSVIRPSPPPSSPPSSPPTSFLSSSPPSILLLLPAGDPEKRLRWLLASR